MARATARVRIVYKVWATRVSKQLFQQAEELAAEIVHALSTSRLRDKVRAHVCCEHNLDKLCVATLVKLVNIVLVEFSRCIWSDEVKFRSDVLDLRYTVEHSVYIDAPEVTKLADRGVLPRELADKLNNILMQVDRQSWVRPEYRCDRLGIHVVGTRYTVRTSAGSTDVCREDYEKVIMLAELLSIDYSTGKMFRLVGIANRAVYVEEVYEVSLELKPETILMLARAIIG